MDHLACLEDALPPAEVVLEVEVCQKSQSTARPEVIKEHVYSFLRKEGMTVPGKILTVFNSPLLTEHVSYVLLCETEGTRPVKMDAAKFRVSVFQLNEDVASAEMVEDEELSAAQHWLLPCREFEGLWESLVYDENIKSKLLRYAATTMMFSDRKVDNNIVSWNRVILLHGPPGTGKTSLCKALAQKLTIRMNDRYRYGQLIEVNSHSLFSKWFSESGKLVMKMFQKIKEISDDQDALVFVLIDEVESLSASRQASINGSEPTDAVRVVNALLTQLDMIKRYPNVLILTTSNVTGAIDLAFVDRADIKQYIGPPSCPAIYHIFRSCIQELVKGKIVQLGSVVFSYWEIELAQSTATHEIMGPSLRLRQISERCKGLSGRTLRKLPFMACAIHSQMLSMTLEQFLEALALAVEQQFKERADLEKREETLL